MIKKTLSLGLMFLSLSAFADVDAVLKSFPPPPAAGSEVDVADLAKVHEYQKSRTPEDCKRTQYEASLTIEKVFAPPYGPLTLEETQKLKQLYWHIFTETDEYVNGLKIMYKRDRPFQRDASIVLCVPSHNSTSYPSGHSTISHVAANIFATLIPAKAEALKARADQMAEDRVLGGVHHPSDVQAGKNLAEIVTEKLLVQPNMQIPLENAKKSLSNPL